MSDFEHSLSVTTRAVATITFIFLTAPVGAHMLARVAYLRGVPFWKGTVLDELRGRYDLDAQPLRSGPPPEENHDEEE